MRLWALPAILPAFAIVTSAWAEPPLLYLKFDSATKTLMTAVSTAAAIQELTPVLEQRINATNDFRDARIALTIDDRLGGEIGVDANASASYRYFPALDQWARISCRLEAVLHLTAVHVRDARIELTNPTGLARSCSAAGDLADALGNVGNEATKAVVNMQLGPTPWSASVRKFLDGNEVRQRARQLFGFERIPDETTVRLARCNVGHTAAICAEVKLP
jgi:hypothetical protein